MSSAVILDSVRLPNSECRAVELMGWLRQLLHAVTGTVDKEALIRRLLKHRIDSDPNARALGQAQAIADGLDAFQLLALPEATIVTCVETWAVLARRGCGEDEVVRRIGEFRGLPLSGDPRVAAFIMGGFDAALGHVPTPRGVEALIRSLMSIEHSNSAKLTDAHVDWCIREARAAYRI